VEDFFNLLLPAKQPTEKSLRAQGSDGTFFAVGEHKTVGYVAPLNHSLPVCNIDTNDSRSVAYTLKGLSYAIFDKLNAQSLALTRKILQDAERHNDTVEVSVRSGRDGKLRASYRNERQAERFKKDWNPGELGWEVSAFRTGWANTCCLAR
jgi:hypothetical protein